MNEIKNHSTSPKHFVIFNPTAAVVKRATELTAGGWTKIQSNGAVVCHINYRRDFESLIENENRRNTKITVDLLGDFDEVEKFASNFFNKYEASESFVDLATRYNAVINSRNRGENVSCKAAEEMAAKIEAGITVAEMETWLLR